MADDKGSQSWVVGLIVAAVISGGVGLLFVSSQQGAKNQQNHIDALPALEARVAALEASTSEEEIDRLRGELSEVRTALAGQLDRDALDDVLQQLRDAISAVEAQLNRRLTLEVKEPIYRELDTISGLLSELNGEIENNEDKVQGLGAIVSRLEAIIARQ